MGDAALDALELRLEGHVRHLATSVPVAPIEADAVSIIAEELLDVRPAREIGIGDRLRIEVARFGVGRKQGGRGLATLAPHLDASQRDAALRPTAAIEFYKHIPDLITLAIKCPRRLLVNACPLANLPLQDRDEDAPAP